MSREVEVKNIQMTATTPEDIQLSLGTIGTDASTAETSGKGKSLTASTGVLVKTSTTADNGQVLAPNGDSWNWANTADISKYYAIGKLIPASSINGKIELTAELIDATNTKKMDYIIYTNALIDPEVIPES